MIAFKNKNITRIETLLDESSIQRIPLPTADYYVQIVNAFMNEPDQTLATNLLRYLLFFNMKNAHETAIPYLIEQYGQASPSSRERIISSYCYNAVTIFLEMNQQDSR